MQRPPTVLCRWRRDSLDVLLCGIPTMDHEQQTESERVFPGGEKWGTSASRLVTWGVRVTGVVCSVSWKCALWWWVLRRSPLWNNPAPQVRECKLRRTLYKVEIMIWQINRQTDCSWQECKWAAKVEEQPGGFVDIDKSRTAIFLLWIQEAWVDMRINGFLKLRCSFEIGTVLHESQINYLSMCQTSGEMTVTGTFSSMSGSSL